ncbi:hypothetical protein REPUB_Repub14bG0152300 [Reevesia pubescens]
MASDKSHQPMKRIPPGYRFVPTDEELVLLYLSKKARGEPVYTEAVIDKEIYGDNDMEPWKIFGEKSSQKFYIFTKLKKKGKGKRNIERKAGCGTWKGQRTEPVKDSQNNQVGFKKLFVFQVKAGSSTSNNANNGHWLMHEFSLLNDQSDYVLCEIRNKRAINTVDDQPQRKKVRLSNSIEEEQDSFIGAATPASDEASGFAATSKYSFIEATTSVGAEAEDEFITEEFVRELLGAEDAKQVQVLNESTETTNVQESTKRGLQQESKEGFSKDYPCYYTLSSDIKASFMAAAELPSTSASTSADKGFSDFDFYRDLFNSF